MLKGEGVSPHRKGYLAIPNVCRNSNVLAIVIVAQLMITVAWLLNFKNMDWSLFGLWSLYGMWVVLLITVILCYSREHIKKYNYWLGCLWVITASLMSLLCVELVASFWITGFSYIDLDIDRVTRLSFALVLFCLILLRFFEFLTTLEQRNKSEAESRFLALQSRIQPHFLFNSLNTISELTVTSPEQAEQAINSLSMLFRASLENKNKTHSLKKELVLCERYIELERWRLGHNLKITWSMHIDNSDEWSVPKLLIQPLVENAIAHGRQADGLVEINIDTRESSRYLSIMIENSKGVSADGGHGIALNNIRERLEVLYDDQQTLRIKDNKDSYSVLVRIPKMKSD